MSMYESEYDYLACEMREDPLMLDESEGGITSIAFDPECEAAFAGSAGGRVGGVMLPDVDFYSVARSHVNPVVDLCFLGETVASVSTDALRVGTRGGASLGAYRPETAGCSDFVSAFPVFGGRGAATQLMLGDAYGLSVFDLVAAKAVARADLDASPIFARGPVQRGMAVVGTAQGQLSIRDPRTSFTVVQQMQCETHPGGLASLSCHGDLVATCGFQTRNGRIAPDSMVRMYDVRMGLRILHMIPVPGSPPTALAFDPSSRMGHLFALGSDRFHGCGILYLIDGPNATIAGMQGVPSDGGTMTALDVSSSGELIVTGDSVGAVRVFCRGDIQEPIVNRSGQHLEMPPPPRRPLLRMTERDSFGRMSAALGPPTDEDYPLLSDIDLEAEMAVGLPPRKVDPALAKALKRSPDGWILFAPNPHYSRGQARGEATDKSHALRSQRHELRVGVIEEDYSRKKEDKIRERTEAGLPVLPQKLRRIEVRVHTEGLAKFEEWDFSFHNRTIFAGLENDMANAYCNAILQALYFTPPLCKALLEFKPSADQEFRITDELALLFRMMRVARGQPCQAKNFIRALRQAREAVALGLLESNDAGSIIASSDLTDIEVETSKDRSLPRRAQSLCRFLLELLHKELLKPAGGRLEGLLTVPHRQLTQVVTKVKAERTNEGRQMLIDLQYPFLKTAAEAAAIKGKADAAPEPPAAPPADRPSFAGILEATLRRKDEPMRAWFDDSLQYQIIQQQRCPTALPEVLTVATGLHNRHNLTWWAPVTGADGTQRPWLPDRIRIDADPATYDVRVCEGAEAEAEGSSPPMPLHATYRLSTIIAHVSEVEDFEIEAKGPAAVRAREGHLVAHVNVGHPYVDLSTHTALATPMTMPGVSPLPLGRALSRTAAEAAEAEATAAELVYRVDMARSLGDPHPPVTPPPSKRPSGPLDAGAFGTPVITPMSVSRGTAGATPSFRGERASHMWVSLNDFHVQESTWQEVTDPFGGQQVPVLLFFRRTDGSAEANDLPVRGAEVLTAKEFAQIARAPSLQEVEGTPAALTLGAKRFTPLDMSTEAPRPGMLLGIDAEFVAFSTAEKTVENGVEIVTRPARLGLARVSVVRGEGPRGVTCCLDDHVRAVEPVVDYLTRFSGVQEGDLDAQRSKHYLTNLKASYLKLRYLLDQGCVFVGHGLKKDFKMLNLLVPAEQMIDTVELFHFKRQRKLSLRFLAAFLLGIEIQHATHDSIEDASVAVKLYLAYRDLVARGVFEETLLGMYRFGKQHLFEPAGWPEGAVERWRARELDRQGKGPAADAAADPGPEDA